MATQHINYYKKRENFIFFKLYGAGHDFFARGGCAHTYIANTFRKLAIFCIFKA